MTTFQICADCGAEFKGSECPTCGSKKPEPEVRVVRLTRDLAVTPQGEPNQTRVEYDRAYAEERERAFEAARERSRQAAEIRRFHEGGGDVGAAMRALALSFHVIREHYDGGELAGLAPFQPELFWKSAFGRLSGPSLQAAAFVLHVYNPDGAWALDEHERAEEREVAKRRGEEDPFPDGTPPPLRFEHARAMARPGPRRHAVIAKWKGERAVV